MKIKFLKDITLDSYVASLDYLGERLIRRGTVLTPETITEYNNYVDMTFSNDDIFYCVPINAFERLENKAKLPLTITNH